MRRWWPLIRDALRGAPYDYTEGPRRPRDRAARGPDGARDGDGVALRGRRRLLRLAARRRRGGDGRRSPSRCSPSSTRWRWGSASAPRRWWPAASARRTRRARRRRRCRRSLLGPGRRHVLGVGRRAHRAAAARADGRDAVDDRVVAGLYAGDAGRQRHRHAAVPDQRDLPRRGRRGDRDAGALARERDQHRAGSLPDLRARAVPRAGRDRRGGGHHHRPRHRGGASQLWMLSRPAAAAWHLARRHLALVPARDVERVPAERRRASCRS